jgi:hypothetical protein
VTGRPGPRGRAALALGACVAAAFAPALSASRVFFQRDILAYWYPQMTVLRQAYAEGAWPLWNPWLGFGAPFLADGSFQLAYPPTWLAVLLPLAWQFKLIAAGHCLLAAAGACALGRRLGFGWTAAAAAGSAYALSGPLLSAASLFHHYAGAAWMPWLLWALVGFLERPSGASRLRLGVLLGVQLLAASGDMLLCAGLLGLLLACWHLARARPAPRALAGSAAGLLLAAALGLSIGAAQWLPTAEQARSGMRAVQDARTSTYWSLHPVSSVDLVVPRLVSDLPLSPAWRGRLYEGREPLLACLYLGAVPLALALLGVALGPGRAAPAATGLCLFVAASLGRHTPLYALLLSVPGFGLLRYPQKFLLPAALCAALVAGAGVEHWGREWGAGERRRARRTALLLAAFALALVAAWWLAERAQPPFASLLAAGVDVASAAQAAGLRLARSALLLLLVVALLWRRGAAPAPRRAGLALALGAGALDLALVAHATLALAPSQLVECRPAVVGLPGVEPGSRVHAAVQAPDCLALRGGPAGWPAEWTAALSFQEALRPPAAARYAVFGSFDGEFTGLGSPWSAALNGVVHQDLASPGVRRLLRLAGVDRVLRVGRDAVIGLPEQERLAVPYACPLQVLRVPDPLPRARVVHAARVASGIDATVAALLAPAFDPAQEVVLEAGPAGLPTAAPPASAGDSSERVEWLSRGLDRIELSVAVRAPGWLVVSEAFDPGWQATVDGERVALWRADGVFRAVRLAPGRHRVEMVYRPWAARVGGAATAAGVLAAAALAAASWLRARLRRGQRGQGRIALAGGGR